MIKRKSIATLLLFFLVGNLSLFAQNEKFKALFVYNFLKNIEWPEMYQRGDLIIGVVGNSPITKELENIAGTQKVGNQSIKVKSFASVDGIPSCHLIYVTTSKGSSISHLISGLSGSNTLVVSESKGGIQQGSAINFTMDGDKLNFEICKNHIEQYGLKVSARLLSLGIPVNL